MRGPNMSYCKHENTSRAMDQVLEGLREAEEEDLVTEYVAELSEDEQRGLSRMLRQAEILMEFKESYSIDL